MVTHAEGGSPLGLILGKRLDAVCFVLDYVTFQFGGLGLAALAAPLFIKEGRTLSAEESGYRDALCSQIGQTVVAVSDSPHSLEVTLALAAKIVLPLDAEYPPGPEMATLSGKGHFMAWLRPSSKP